MNNTVERGTADLGIPTTLTSSRGSRPILIFLLGAPSNPNTLIEQPIRQVQQGRPARLRRMLAMPAKWKSQGDYFFPLVVESLGLWTPSSLRVIRQIARGPSLWAASPGHKPSATSYNNCPCAYGHIMQWWSSSDGHWIRRSLRGGTSLVLNFIFLSRYYVH